MRLPTKETTPIEAYMDSNTNASKVIFDRSWRRSNSDAFSDRGLAFGNCRQGRKRVKVARALRKLDREMIDSSSMQLHVLTRLFTSHL